ncbi:MAG: redoxin family protein [Bryobacterales bacterium]|nr:redoxin family protein [Bryobacterales bacterium]
MKLALALCVFAVAPAQTPKLDGIWDAAVVNAGLSVPFRMQISSRPGKLSVALLDGDSKIESTSASFQDGRLNVKWDYYDATLEAALDNGVLRGEYGRRTRRGPVRMAFTARPFQPVVVPGKGVANFSGQWTLKAGENAGAIWSATFRQAGAEVTGTIQAVDGDFGALSGTVKGDTLTLSHFDAIRTTLLELRLKPDGSLEGVMNGSRAIRGARASEAAARGIPSPPDPSRYTNVKDPSEPLRFTAPDLDGKPVSASDFRGKVLVVSIMGSWCPNCHDEAPFFEELYRKYKSRGLRVAALAFEYTGEVERDREQVRAFNRRHGVTYPTLLAGTTNDGEVQRVLPQLANFGAFPTSLFVGRDGRVRNVHTGFSGPATGAAFTQLKAELEHLVVQLLDEK